MENNTVILSLERYHELQQFEKAVLERKELVLFDNRCTGRQLIYLTSESEKLEQALLDNSNKANEIRKLELEIKNQKYIIEIQQKQVNLLENKIVVKKWWQIWE